MGESGLKIIVQTRFGRIQMCVLGNFCLFYFFVFLFVCVCV